MDLTARYTMGVFAQSVSDAVHCAGGLMFDRAASGWDVTVYAPEDACSLAIEILGAKHDDLESLMNDNASFPTSLVVAANLRAANRRVEAYVAAVLATGATEVLFAGLGASPDAAYGDVFSYSLGRAARAFKTRAVLTTGVRMDTIGGSEPFRPVAARSRPSLMS